MTPRPAILFTAAYWAGLATGLLRFGAPSFAMLVAIGLGLIWRPLGLVAGGGLLARSGCERLDQRDAGLVGVSEPEPRQAAVASRLQIDVAG